MKRLLARLGQPYYVLRLVLGAALVAFLVLAERYSGIDPPWWTAPLFAMLGDRLVHRPLSRIQPEPDPVERILSS